MRIGIIGSGFVGSAVAHAHSNDQIVINDPRHPKSTPLTEFTECDAIYVCVPSPSTQDGHCDTAILEDVLKQLLFVNIATQIPIISKVTAPPGVYARLQEQYPNLVHAPEFLTAKNAMWDYKYGKFAIVGGNTEWSIRAMKVIASGLVEIREGDIILTDIKTASFYKYLMNSYLAMKVTFMNDFFELASAHKLNWEEVRTMLRKDSRIGESHTTVPGPDGQYGWGGFCFPKDVAAICEEALDNGLDFPLMQQVEMINKKHRRKND
jgi:UDPglucose 6-dehydrogenase